MHVLHEAVSQGASPEALEALVAAADLMDKDGKGRTAHTWASSGSSSCWRKTRTRTSREAFSEALVRWLVSNTADVDACDESEQTPLQIAVRLGLHEVATSLIDARRPGAGAEAAGTLHQAAINGDVPMISLLLGGRPRPPREGGAARGGGDAA